MCPKNSRNLPLVESNLYLVHHLHRRLNQQSAAGTSAILGYTVWSIAFLYVMFFYYSFFQITVNLGYKDPFGTKPNVVQQNSTGLYIRGLQ